MGLKLKINEEGIAELKDGMPVFIHDDGKEIPFDAEGTLNRVSALNAEAMNHRRAKEAAEARLAAYAGIEDPQAAIKAMEMLRNIDDKKLVDAGKVEEVRAHAVKTMEERLQAAERNAAQMAGEKDTVIKTLKSQLDSTIIDGAFYGSQYIKENLVIPTDFAKAMYRDRFAVEDGKLVAYYDAGHQERIYSRIRAGDPNVSFDEAMEQIVERDRNKDSILRGTQHQGSGAQNSSGGGVSQAKPAREMDAEEKASFIGKFGLDKWTQKLRAET